MSKNKLALSILPSALVALGFTACGDQSKYNTEKEPAAQTREVRLALQSTDGGFLLGLDGTIAAYRDLSGDAGAPCSVLSEVVATEDTTPDDVSLAFALTVGEYCFELLPGWTLYYNTSTDASVSWQEIPATDVDLISDNPVATPITMNGTATVTYEFDWVPVTIDEDFGVANTDIVVFTNDCSGECGADAGASELCAIINDTPAACYPSCTLNADCEDVCPLNVGGSDGLCLRGNVPMADPGVCVCL